MSLTDDDSVEVKKFYSDLKIARQEVSEFKYSGDGTPEDLTSAQLSNIKRSAFEELKELETRIQGHVSGSEKDADAAICKKLLWRLVGRHVELVIRLNQQWFFIKERYSDQYPKVIDDITIIAMGAAIPPGAAALKLDIDATITTIKAVMNDRIERLSNRRYAGRLRAICNDQNDYMRQLLGIAQVGLLAVDSSLILFARDDLSRLRKLFTIREAGKVKNDYLNRLWKVSAFVATIFAASYMLCVAHETHLNWLNPDLERIFFNTRNFHLLAVGTSIGTWLSFSLRRSELTFDDLAVLEPDRLYPATRVVFMVGLALFVGLLLSSGAVVAGVGSVTGFDALHKHGSWSLLIGLLAGVGERSIGTAVRRRSEDFSTSIGGLTKSSPASQT